MAHWYPSAAWSEPRTGRRQANAFSMIGNSKKRAGMRMNRGA